MKLTKAAAAVVGLTVGALSVLAPAPAGAAKAKTVNVKLQEFKIKPATKSVKAGTIRFKVKNIGGLVHEMVVVRTDGAALPLAADGSVDEDTIPEADFVGEVEDVDPKKTKAFTAKGLASGTYTLFCNVVDTSGTPALAHYEQGMHTTFTVR
jgi:uncharacterized cupredoxin-like copper-binding protein